MIRRVTTAAAMAAFAALAMTPGAADAAMHKHAMMHKRMTMAKKMRLVPAALKPSYHGYAGYPGGPAGVAPPMLIDVPQVAPGGGVLGMGLVPGTGVFKDVPILGQFGL